LTLYSAPPTETCSPCTVTLDGTTVLTPHGGTISGYTVSTVPCDTPIAGYLADHQFVALCDNGSTSPPIFTNPTQDCPFPVPSIVVTPNPTGSSGGSGGGSSGGPILCHTVVIDGNPVEVCPGGAPGPVPGDPC